MADKKHLIVLMIDDDTARNERAGMENDSDELTPEMLTRIGSHVNDDAAGIYGYEGWLVIPNVSKSLLTKLQAAHVHIDLEESA